MTNPDNFTCTAKEVIWLLIENHRKSKKISQQELATRLQVDRQYIWKLENGKVNLTMNYLDRVIKELSCLHSDFLVEIEKKMNDKENEY